MGRERGLGTGNSGEGIWGGRRLRLGGVGEVGEGKYGQFIGSGRVGKDETANCNIVSEAHAALLAKRYT